MKITHSFACLLSAAAIGCGGGNKPMGEAIPLSEAWGYALAGTKDIRDLEPESYGRDDSPEGFEAFKSSRVQSILAALSDPDTQRAPAPAFLVKGTDDDALESAYHVLAGGRRPAQELPAGETLSLVFYTTSSGASVDVESIRKLDGVVRIEYRFRRHWTNESSAHLALIPLGDLPEGPARIEVVRLRPDSQANIKTAKDVPQEYESVVSQSFRYEIVP